MGGDEGCRGGGWGGEGSDAITCNLINTYLITARKKPLLICIFTLQKRVHASSIHAVLSNKLGEDLIAQVLFTTKFPP